jgi:hypothetical protein
MVLGQSKLRADLCAELCGDRAAMRAFLKRCKRMVNYKKKSLMSVIEIWNST